MSKYRLTLRIISLLLEHYNMRKHMPQTPSYHEKFSRQMSLIRIHQHNTKKKKANKFNGETSFHLKSITDKLVTVK